MSGEEGWRIIKVGGEMEQMRAGEEEKRKRGKVGTGTEGRKKGRRNLRKIW